MNNLLGERLRQEREKRNLTQLEVANLLKISRPTYAKYELGQREPNIETLSILGDLFDCTIDYLVGRVDNPNYIKKELPSVNGEKLEVVYLNKSKILTDDDKLLEKVNEMVEKIMRDREGRNQD